MTAVAEGAPMPPAETAEAMTAAVLVDAIYEQSMEYWSRDPAQNRLEQLGIVRTDLKELKGHLLAEFGYGLQVKYEGAQQVGAYKGRGAAAAILAAQDRGEKFTRVVSASAGNLGQGLHFVAARAGLEPALILAAKTISPYKKNKMVKAGAVVDSRYATLEDALTAATELGQQPDHLLVHPFDSIDTMSGQASVAQELVDDLLLQQSEGKIDLHRDNISIMVPGGGGGLGAATAAVFAKLREYGVMGKGVRVVVAQMAGCDQIARLRHGRPPLTAEALDTSCDGTAVLEPGKLAMKILADPNYVSDVVSVPKAVLAKTMRYLSDLHGELVEPAGALSMAAAMFMAAQQGQAPSDNRRHVFVTVTSGINVSPQAFADFHPDTMTDEQRNVVSKAEEKRRIAKPAPTATAKAEETGQQTAPTPHKTAQAAGSIAASQTVRAKTPEASTVQLATSTPTPATSESAPYSQTDTGGWIPVDPTAKQKARPIRNPMLSAPTAGYHQGVFDRGGRRYYADGGKPKEKPRPDRRQRTPF